MLAAALALLAACAADRPPVLANTAAYKSVAVIAAIPSKIDLGTTGLFVFDNDHDTVDVPDWHLDSLALDAATRALSPHYRIAFALADDQFVDTDSPLTAALEHSTVIQDYARKHAQAGHPADIVIVLCESVRVFPNTNPPPIIQFVGVQKLRDPLLTRPPFVHSYILATIMDGKTLNIITETPLLLPPHKRAGGPFGNGAWGVGGAYPEELLPGFQWKDHWRDLTEDQRTLIHDKITYLLSTSTYYTLQTTLTAGGS